MNRKNHMIIKEIYKQNINLKHFYKYIILKSLIHNYNIENNKRVYSNLLMLSIPNTKFNKICLNSGKYSKSNNNLNVSRHNINYFLKLGLLQNFKIKSW